MPITTMELTILYVSHAYSLAKIVSMQPISAQVVSIKLIILM